jgi:hypothetical protein
MSTALARLVVRVRRLRPPVALVAGSLVLLACAPLGGLVADPDAGDPGPVPTVGRAPTVTPALIATAAPAPTVAAPPDAPVSDDPAVPTVAPPPPPAPAPTVGPAAVEGLAMVERIDVLILESFPVQVHAVVAGSLPDPCTELGAPTQGRDGNAISVTIPTTRDPEVVCAQVITPFEVTVPLAGEFPPGSYTVTVNGVAQAFQV